MYKIADIADLETPDEKMSVSDIRKKADKLMRLIENEGTDKDTRRKAVRNVGKYRIVGNLLRMTTLLLKIVQDKNEERTVRHAAGAVLGNFPESRVSEALIKILSDDTEDPALHEEIQFGISGCGSSQTKSKFAKIFTSKFQADTTRERVGECLWNPLPDGIQNIMKVFRDSTESLAIRKSAASILAFQENPKATDILEAFLGNKDTEPELRKRIADSVDWRLIARTDIPVQILRDGNETVELRIAVIINFVSSLCVDEGTDAVLVSALIEVLNNQDEEPQIRSEVCKALEKEFASPAVEQAIKNYKA